MNIEIIKNYSGDLVVLNLEQGEEIHAEAGTLVAMSEGITMETQARKGLLKGLRRLLMGSENLFINKYSAAKNKSEIILAPLLKGEIIEKKIDKPFFVQSKAFLASIGDIETDINFPNSRIFYNSEKVFLLKIEGSGKIIFGANGGVYLKKLAQGEKYRVSSGHVLAFSDEVLYESGIVPGGLKEAVFGASTIVAEFTGPGEIYLQTCGDFINERIIIEKEKIK